MMRNALVVTLLLASSLSAGTLPKPDHIVIVYMENKAYSDVVGNTTFAPYINSLLAKGALFSAYSAMHHPSQPNYFELFAGAQLGVCNDNCTNGQMFSQANLGSNLIAKHLTFTGFAENLPIDRGKCSGPGNYLRRHAPFTYFSNLPKSATVDFSKFPADFTKLPTVSFVTPNAIDIMHSLTSTQPPPGVSSTNQEIRNGDTWLKSKLGKYIEWAQKPASKSLFILSFDEDSSTYTMPSGCPGIDTPPPANLVLTLVIGGAVKPATYSATTVPYNLLRTIEDMYGLAHLPGSANVGGITNIWQ